MNTTLDQILKAQRELSSESDSQSLPAFLSKFTKPLELIQTWAHGVTQFCQQVANNREEFEQKISQLEEQVEELNQRTTNLEQSCVGQLREFVEANQ